MEWVTSRRGWTAGVLGRRWLSWLLVLSSLVGCGRTARNCEDCGEQSGSAGASAAGGVGGVGTGGTSGGGQSGSSGVAACTVGAVDTPLVRYTTVDLEWTMDDVIGPGPALAPGVSERFDQAVTRVAHLDFVRNLLEVAEARVGAAAIDDSRLVVCDGDLEDRSGCVDEWIRQNGRRLYRRPLTDDEITGYVAQFNGLEGSSPLLAARAVLTSMLLSPYFVFRVELGVPTLTVRDAAPPAFPPLPAGTLLSGFEVAARLSHFLLRRAPDERLLDSAASGKLHDRAALAEEVERLLALPDSGRARALQHMEWLGLENSGVLGPDEAVTEKLKQQTTAFITDVLERREGTFTELLTSSRHPVNATIAEHTGIDVDVGEAFEWIDLEPTLYAGVFGQGAWLARNPRPTYRGQSVLDLLCSKVPPPPLVGSANLVGSTPRERIINATSEPSCQSCHRQTDPIGFSLEAFDHIGRLTGFDTRGQLRLPTSGEVYELAGPLDLGLAIAHSRDGQMCAARRYVEYAFEHSYDPGVSGALFECLVSRSTTTDLNLNELTRQVALSDAMQLMSRPVTQVSTGSAALDPVDRAIEETASLMLGFGDDDRTALYRYHDALLQLRAERL